MVIFDYKGVDKRTIKTRRWNMRSKKKEKSADTSDKNKPKASKKRNIVKYGVTFTGVTAGTTLGSVVVYTIKEEGLSFLKDLLRGNSNSRLVMVLALIAVIVALVALVLIFLIHCIYQLLLSAMSMIYFKEHPDADEITIIFFGKEIELKKKKTKKKKTKKKKAKKKKAKKKKIKLNRKRK